MFSAASQCLSNLTVAPQRPRDDLASERRVVLVFANPQHGDSQAILGYEMLIVRDVDHFELMWPPSQFGFGILAQVAAWLAKQA